MEYLIYILLILLVGIIYYCIYLTEKLNRAEWYISILESKLVIANYKKEIKEINENES